MKIIAGDMTLDIISAIGAPASFNGMVVDSIRLILPGDITGDQIQKLAEYPWNIHTDDGAFIQAHSGFNKVTEYSITFIREPNEAALMVELAHAADEITRISKERDALVQERDDLVQERDSLTQERDSLIQAKDWESPDVNKEETAV